MLYFIYRSICYNAGPVLPKYYYVPRESIELEKANPGSQDRDPSGEGMGRNLFLWGQSVYIISQLLGIATFIISDILCLLLFDFTYIANNAIDKQILLLMFLV